MRKPKKCPKCGSDDIGQLDHLDSGDDEDYEQQGGRWYCVACGWGEDLNSIRINSSKKNTSEATLTLSNGYWKRGKMSEYVKG